VSARRIDDDCHPSTNGSEPPAADLIRLPERNGGGDRGRQSAAALHCIACTAVGCMSPAARPESLPHKNLPSRARVNSRFPVTFTFLSEIDVRQLAETALPAGCFCVRPATDGE